MIYKIYSPRNRTSDFPTWWQWSKFITIHTVKVSAKMEDTERFVRLSVEAKTKASAGGTTEALTDAAMPRSG